MDTRGQDSMWLFPLCEIVAFVLEPFLNSVSTKCKSFTHSDIIYVFTIRRDFLNVFTIIYKHLIALTVRFLPQVRPIIQ